MQGPYPVGPGTEPVLPNSETPAPTSARMPSRGRLWAIAISLLVVSLVLGSLTVKEFVLPLQQAKEAVEWPTANGKVIQSTIWHNCGTGRRAGEYAPRVRYSFSVDGREFFGYRIAFGSIGCGSEEHAQSIASQYPALAAVQVHYDPDDPNSTTLVVGDILPDAWVDATKGAVVVVFCLIMSILTFVQLARREQPALRSRVAAKEGAGP